MKADPKFSEGARVERKAFRDHLRREMKKPGASVWLDDQLKWVLKRQARYDKKPGGLGK